MKSLLSIKIEGEACSLYSSHYGAAKMIGLTPEQASKIKDLVDEFYYLGIGKGKNYVEMAVRNLPFPEDLG